LNLNPKTVFLFLILFPLVAFVSGKKKYINPSGTYELVSKTIHRNNEVFGRMGEIKVINLSRTKIILRMDLSAGATSYNSGEFIDTMNYDGHTCVNRSMEDDRSCKIRFVFSTQGVKVFQRSDDANFGCGFGHAVYADGFYRKINPVKKRK